MGHSNQNKNVDTIDHKFRNRLLPTCPTHENVLTMKFTVAMDCTLKVVCTGDLLTPELGK